jgi:hypothetical protein
VFDQIEKLKRELTDKYVVVDDRVPELRRFVGHVGQIKTVNMNGRALVEFDAWNNIGWYDIETECLKVVPKPQPAAETAKHAAKPAAAKPAAAPKAAVAAGEKKLSPLEMARMQGAVKHDAASGTAKATPDKPAAGKPEVRPAAPGGKPSTADILAAARAAKAATAPAAPAKPASGGKPNLSTADILAAARAKAAPVSEAAAAAQQSAPLAAEEETASAVAEPPAAPAKPAASKPAAAPSVKPGERPSISEILVWCRQHDSK